MTATDPQQVRKWRAQRVVKLAELALSAAQTAQQLIDAGVLAGSPEFVALATSTKRKQAMILAEPPPWVTA